MGERAAGGEAAGAHLAVGTVRKPHGVKGELQVALDTDRPAQVFRPGRSLEVGDASGKPTGRRVTLARSRPFKEGLLVQLEECGDRDAADALRGATLLIPAGEATPAAADEVPYHVLVGSTVLVGDREIGTVREVLETAGAELLVVRRPGAADALVPFVKEMVVGIDAERREVRIEPPEGLLEL